MPFQIQNIIVNESVEQSLINTNISTLSYNPVWIFDTSANNPGYFTTDISGFKVVNEIDSNGINIKYWLNTLKVFIIANVHISGGLDTFITGVAADNGSKYFIQGLDDIIDNENNTYTILGGDLSTGIPLTNGTKYYFSYITK